MMNFKCGWILISIITILLCRDKRYSERFLATSVQCVIHASGVISDTAIKGKKALLTIINDYGSEDLKAELKRNSDGTYTLTRLSGSTMKIVVDNKWVKIPKDITFYVKQKR